VCHHILTGVYLCEAGIDQPVQWLLYDMHNAQSITNIADSFFSWPKTRPEPVPTQVQILLGVSWFQSSAELLIIHSLFCGVTYRWFSGSCRRFGTTHRSRLQGSCSPRRISITNYLSTLPSIPEDRRSQLLVGLFPVIKGRDVNLTPNLNQLPRWKMIRAIPLSVHRPNFNFGY
jgi:hypothetical protein